MIGPAVVTLVRAGLRMLRENAPEESAEILAEEFAKLAEVRPNLARDLVAGAAADLAANAPIPWREYMLESGVAKRRARG